MRVRQTDPIFIKAIHQMAYAWNCGMPITCSEKVWSVDHLHPSLLKELQQVGVAPHKAVIFVVDEEAILACVLLTVRPESQASASHVSQVAVQKDDTLTNTTPSCLRPVLALSNIKITSLSVRYIRHHCIHMQSYLCE